MNYTGRHQAFDTGCIKTYPLSTRTNKVQLKDLVFPRDIEARGYDLPDETCSAIESLADAMVTARADNKPVILFTGAHVIKNGLGDLVPPE